MSNKIIEMINQKAQFLNQLSNNEDALLNDALNKPKAFDKKIKLENRDRLEVTLCNNSDKDSLCYNFKFSGKIWESI